MDVNILCTVHAANADHPLDVYRFFRDELKTEFIPIIERVTAQMLPARERRGYAGRGGRGQGLTTGRQGSDGVRGDDRQPPVSRGGESLISSGFPKCPLPADWRAPCRTHDINDYGGE